MLLPYTILPLLLAARLAYSQHSTSSTTSTRSSNATVSNYPVKTIFLPIDVPNNLAASVITAGPSRTVYAIGCLQTWEVPETTNFACEFGSSVILTEGPSTVIYTMTSGAGTAAGRATVNCHLVGDGSLATAATCTGRSAIPGLGNVASTSTLSNYQIQYESITITAGEVKLTAFPTGARDVEAHGSSTSTGVAAPIGTMRWTAGAVGVCMAMIGAL